MPPGSAPFPRPKGPRAFGRRRLASLARHGWSSRRQFAAAAVSKKDRECRARDRNDRASTGCGQAVESRRRSAATGAGCLRRSQSRSACFLPPPRGRDGCVLRKERLPTSREMSGRTSSSLVQQVQELFDLIERLVPLLADMDDAVAIALQRSCPRFPETSRQECRGYGLSPDIETYDPSPLAVDPEPCSGEEIASLGWEFAKAAGSLLFQLVQFVLADAPGGTAIDFKPNRFRLHVACRQHIRDGQVQIGHPQFRPVVGFLRG